MAGTIYRATLLACYQFVLLAGVVLMPIALAARQVGVRLPLGQLVERLGQAYEQAAAGAAER